MRARGEEEPEMTTREVLLSITRLRKALLSWGELCVRTVEMLAQVQAEIVKQEFQNAQQTILEWWFGPCHASE
jgi:hypothetical protein